MTDLTWDERLARMLRSLTRNTRWTLDMVPKHNESFWLGEYQQIADTGERLAEAEQLLLEWEARNDVAMHEAGEAVEPGDMVVLRDGKVFKA